MKQININIHKKSIANKQNEWIHYKKHNTIKYNNKTKQKQKQNKNKNKTKTKTKQNNTTHTRLKLFFDYMIHSNYYNHVEPYW